MSITIQTTFQVEGAQAVNTATTQVTGAFKTLQDQMKQVESASGQATAKMITGLQGLSQATIRVVTPQGDLGKALLQTGAAAQTQLNQFQRLQQQYAATAQSTNILVTSLKNVASSFGVVLGVTAVIGVLRNFATSIVDAALQMDTARLSLQAVTGSTTAAAKEMLALRAIADQTGVGIDVLAKQWAGLFAAVNQVPGRLEVTRTVFANIIETAARLGKSTDQIGNALYGFTQIAGGATLQLQDFNQIVDALPGVFPALAREMNLSGQELRELIGQGKILVDDVLPKMGTAIKSLAGGGGPVDTLQSQFGRLNTAWTDFLDAIGQLGPILALRTALIGLTGVLQGFAAAARDAKAAIFGAEQATVVANALQNIQVRIDEANKSLASMENASTTGIGGFINQLMGLDQQTAIATKKQEIADLIAAQTALRQSSAGAEAAGPSPDEKRRTDLLKFIGELKKSPAEIKSAIGDINKQLAVLESRDVGLLIKIGLDPLSQQFPQELAAFRTRLLDDRQKLQDELLNIDRKGAASAAREAGQSAVEVAKAAEDRLATQLKREEALIQQSADERRRIADESAAQTLQTRGPGAVEAIAADRARAMQRIAVETAQQLEQLRLDMLTKQTAARESTLRAEIDAAGKNLSARKKAEEELTQVKADAEVARAEITKKRTDVEQQISKKSVDEQIKDARQLNTILEETAQARLTSQIDLIDEQIGLVQAQIDGEVLTTQQGLERIQALQQMRFDETRALYIRQAEVAKATIEAEVQDKAIAAAQIAAIDQDLANKTAALNLKQQTETQRFLNEQVAEWKRFVTRVQDTLGDFLFDVFSGQIRSIKDLLRDLKNFFLRILADMVAAAIANPIAVTIKTVVGGIAGAIGPTLGQAVLGAVGLGTSTGVVGTPGSSGTGIGLQEILGIAGLGKQFGLLDGVVTQLSDGVTFAAQSVADFVNAMKFGTDVATESAINLSAAMDAAIPGTPLPGAGATGAGAVTAGQVIGGISGVAALGIGIYKALNAATIAEKAAWSASAAAGAAALASTALVAAGVVAASAGWTGIGLIAAGVMAVIATILPMVMKPAGPALAVGGVSGLNIGTAGGQLQVQGDLGSRVLRRDQVSPEVAQGVQAQLEEGITTAVVAIVQTINAVALDPAALVGPTQEALQTALNAIQPINTANAKKMVQDLEEQLRFARVAIVGGMLEPLNLAFDQLRDTADAKQQLERLPSTVQGLVDIFKTMNMQIDEINKSQNTDVLRQLSGVRNQVEQFGNRLAGTAGQIAESIVNSIVESFEANAARAAGGGISFVRQAAMDVSEQAMEDFDRTLAEQITQFAGLVNDALGAMAALRSAQQSLTSVGLPERGVSTQIDRLMEVTSEHAARISTEIVSTALNGLTTQLNQVLIQPITIQATTVNSLFNDSLSALQTLWAEWHMLEAAGINVTLIRGQFDRLLGGILDSATQVLDDALVSGTFGEFLNVLESIPKAITDLNPAWARLRELGAIFATVLDPITASITNFEATMRTPAETLALVETRMIDLRDAIAVAGDSADRALPLYAQLAEAVTTNANLQIAAIQAIQQAQERALSQIRGDIDTLEASLGSLDRQIARVSGVLADAIADFNEAAATGDTLAQIQAVEEWGRALVDLADLQIEQSRAVWQVQIDAQQGFVDAIQDSISAQQAFIAGIQDSIGAQQDFISSLEEEISSLQALVALRERVQQTTRAEVSPTRAAEAIRAELAVTTDLEKLIDLNEELIALGKSSSQLTLIQEGLDNLAGVQQQLNDMLAGGQALTVAEQALSAAQAQLAVLESDLAAQEQILRAIEADLAVQQGILASVQASTASDAEVAAIQTQLLANLRGLEQWLVAVEGNTTWEDQILTIQRDAVAQLQQIEQDLKALFLKAVETTGAAGISNNIQNQQLAQLQSIASYNLKLPIPMVVTNFFDAPRQRGGLVGIPSGRHYAQGGLVPAMGEPGEMVFTSPTAAQRGALLAVNQAWPRFARGGFMIPGAGSGDSVPLMVPPDTVFLNRTASRAMGFQQGGPVPSSSSTRRDVIIHVDLRGSTFSKNITLEEFKSLMETLQRRGLQR